jgi:hypothetical protein
VRPPEKLCPFWNVEHEIGVNGALVVKMTRAGDYVVVSNATMVVLYAWNSDDVTLVQSVNTSKTNMYIWNSEYASSPESVDIISDGNRVKFAFSYCYDEGYNLTTG